MRPHPTFANWTIPSTHRLGDFVLKALSVAENERDFNAIMQSTDNIKAAAPQLTWPKGLTLEKNMIDLAWHQKEFEARRSFAWIIESCDGDYLGCVYIYPSITGEKSADVAWWWHRGVNQHHETFEKVLFDWLLSSEWPNLEYRKIIK